MNECECFLLIGSQHGFRPCLVQYKPPKFGGNGAYSVTGVRDKKTGEEYDLEDALRANSLPELVAESVSKRVGLEKPTYQHVVEDVGELPF